MTPPIIVGPLETVAVALRKMRSEKHNLAVVTPRQGVYQGIITLRDLLEVFIGQLGEALP
jgi:CBS domain containing-hemolysin-like protein